MTLPFDATLGKSHPFSVGENNHALLANPNSAGTFYADIAARDADTAFQVAENIGKAVAVTSPLSIYTLMSVGPAVWLSLGTDNPIDTFLELIDVLESTYTGNADKFPTVNTGETGLSFNAFALLNAAGALSGLTQLDVDNLRLDGNTFSSQDTDGPILLIPNGSGFVGIGETAPEAKLHIKDGSAGATTAPGGTTLVIESFQNNFITLFQPDDMSGGIIFGTPAVNVAGAYVYNVSDQHTWSTLNNTIQMVLDSTGSLAVGKLTAAIPSAMLELVSTTRGFFPPSMTSTQRDAISSPVTGLLINNITNNALERFNGAIWVNMASSGDFFGPGSSTNNSLVRFDGVTGKQGKDSPLLTYDGNILKLAQSGFVDSFFNIGDTVERLRMGFKMAAGLTGNASFAQMHQDGSTVNGDLLIGPRTDLDSSLVLFTGNGTTNVGVERVRLNGDGDVEIKDKTEALITTIGTPGETLAPDKSLFQEVFPNTDKQVLALSCQDQLDRSSFGNDLILQGSAIIEEGVGRGGGKGLLLDGTNDTVGRVTQTPSLQNVDFLTVSFWVFVITGSTFSPLVTKMKSSGSPNGWGVNLASGALRIVLRDGASTRDLFPIGAIPTGDWAHVAMTFNQSTLNLKVYINGLIVRDSNEPTGYADSDNDLLIGARFLNTTIEQTTIANAAFSNIEVFNRILEQDEIRTHYLR